MKDLQLDNHGEPLFINGDLVPVIDNDAMAAQQVYITLQSMQGEYDLDTNLGLIPDNLFGKQIVKDYVTKDVVDAVEEQCSLVSRVDNVDIDVDRTNRVMSIKVSYTTIDEQNGSTDLDLNVGGD